MTAKKAVREEVEETVTAQPEAVGQLTEVVSERTEDDVMTQSGLVVVLAGKKVAIPVASYAATKKLRGKCLKWEEVCLELASKEKQFAGMTATDIDQTQLASMMKMKRGQNVLVDEGIDIFFLFAGDHLNREQIENSASLEELWNAFQAAYKTMSPLSSKAGDE